MNILHDRFLNIINNAGLQKYLRNTSWMFAGKFFNIIINFFVGVYIARYLGPTWYGLLNFIISFSGLFLSFASLGIDSLMIRGINLEKEKVNQWMGTGFIFKTLGAVFSFGAVIIGAFAFDFSSETIFFISLYSIFIFFQSFNIIDFYFQSILKAKYTTASYLISSVIVSGLKILFIIFNFDLSYFLFIYVVEILLLSVGLLIFYQATGQSIFKWKFDPKIAKYFALNSWPFMISSVAAAVYFRLDQVLLKYFLGTQVVGVYAVAAKLSEVWSIIPSILCASVFPAVMNAYKSDKLLFNQRLSKLYAFLFYLAIFLALGTTLFAPYIIRILFGPDYVGAISILQIYVWSIVGMFINIALQQYLIANHTLKILLWINLTGMFINIVLNLILIPINGPIGAAISNVLSYILPVIIILQLSEIKSHRDTLLDGILLKNF